MKKGILLSIFLLQLSFIANSSPLDQGVTIIVKNESLLNVLKSIQKQTGYNIIWVDKQMAIANKVTVTLKNVTIVEALDKVMIDQPLGYIIEENEKRIIIQLGKEEISVRRAQIVSKTPLDIIGIVTNEKGEAVSGATVSVKGGKTTTATEPDGTFSLKVSEDKVELVITSIGYEMKTVRVRGERRIEIKLSVTSQEMKQVIISTGYQQVPRERSTGSFTQIDKRTYNEIVRTNVLSGLETVSNGLTTLPQRIPGMKTGITIRGISTASGIKDPLIIVDNFPFNGDINNLNPNDVESITILKDAAASSIWGAKAGNGVIVITTKKGSFNQGLRIDINSNITIGEKPDLFYFKNMSTGDYIGVEEFLFNSGYFNNKLPYPQYFALTPVVNTLYKKQQGQITQEAADEIIDNLKMNDVRREFNEYFYKKSINQQYSINMSGGSNTVAWLISLGYDKNSNELNNSFSRFNARFENTYKLLDNLTFTNSIFYTETKGLSGRPGYGSISNKLGPIPPYSKFADNYGNSIGMYNDYYREGFIDTVGGGKLLDWKYYPLEDYKHSKRTNSVKDFTAILGINYRLLKGVSFDLKFKYQKQQSDADFLQDINSYYTRNLINSFSQIDYISNTVKNIVPKGDILDKSSNDMTDQNVRLQLNLNKSWNNHGIVALIGSEINETKTNGNSYRVYGYNNDVLTSIPVDYINRYPNLLLGSQDLIPNNADITGLNNRFVSFFTNAAYTLYSKYTLSASARRDASNIFGLSTNDKWKPLWSIGASWNVSEESFFNTTFISNLRLRTTYGQSGNIDPSKVASTTFTYYGVNPYTQTPMNRVDNIANPNLKWEQVAMFNLGVDFKAFNNALSGSIEYYRKKMVDLYGSVPVDATTGLDGRTSIRRNVGTMKGSGLDIEVNTLNINKKFRWSSQFIFNYYKDIFTSEDLPNIRSSSIVGNGVFLNGYSPYSYFAYKWGNLDPTTGDPLGYVDKIKSNNYAEITGDKTKVTDLKYIGSLIPRFYGSLGNNFSWKSFNIAIRISYRFDYFFRRESINYSGLYEGSGGHSDFEKRWQKPGDELITNVPSMIYPMVSMRDFFYQNSEILATKGDNIRLEYINLSYNVFVGKNKKSLINSMQIYSVMKNIGFIWRSNRMGIDPDVNENTLPAVKSYSVGMRISF